MMTHSAQPLHSSLTPSSFILIVTMKKLVIMQYFDALLKFVSL
jgi:hypothetical protein